MKFQKHVIATGRNLLSSAETRTVAPDMKRVLFMAAALFLAAACTEPMSKETFRKGEGPYRFDVDMSDSTSVYDFTFYTRIDGGFFGVDAPKEMKMTVLWKSPSDSLFGETVFMPLADSAGTFYSSQITAPYRKGVVPLEWGKWEMEVVVPETIKGMRGLGLITGKTRENGTR